MSEALLEASGLRKVYAVRSPGALRKSEFTAVDNVSFAVPAGGALAIVGESGSGKTTCARMVVGLERPSGGELLVDGRSREGRARAKDRRARARQIQMVFQDPYLSLDPRQRIRDCLGEALGLHFDLTRDQLHVRTDALLDQVGLDSRQGDALPRALSGGQRQRAAIARALAAEPRLLILDEAVAALDVSIQAQVLNLLADIRADTGIAYVFITHDLAVARQICDDAIVMNRGKIVERGSVDRVLESPQEPYTRRLVSSVPRPGWKPRRRAAAAS
ncbi:ABC transporter ATP-binding protein [Streptomyces sp. NBC_00063]|uniref:ABC transporter ATP-binding protein n=1 Tax=Streptomyces sp. NBC_00063 TaxID=2975638 RepID=UPI003D71A85C